VGVPAPVWVYEAVSPPYGGRFVQGAFEIGTEILRKPISCFKYNHESLNVKLGGDQPGPAPAHNRKGGMRVWKRRGIMKKVERLSVY
jgi:hypothetical protein